MSKVNVKALHELLSLPPNKANARVTGPLLNVEAVQQGLLSAGLTADDLKPIDWRKKGISPPMNQRNCGSCWAMSSTAALCDRFILQKNLPGLILEPVITAQCTPEMLNQGCNGGSPAAAGKFFEDLGIPNVSNNCPPWDSFCSDNSCTLPSCDELKGKCHMKDIKLYKAVKGSTRSTTAVSSGNNVDPSITIINMKKELMNGPFVCTYFVPIDFMTSAIYKWEKTGGIFINGAYNDILDKKIPDNVKQHIGNPKGKQWQDIMMSGSNPSAHAVLVSGWDVGDAGEGYGKVPYWIVKNSWGTEWMDGGYFKIAMSTSGHNNLLGFDVPVSAIVLASSGQKTDLGGLFGSGTAFDPDIGTGHPINHQLTDHTSNKHKIITIISISLISLVILGILFLAYKGISKKGKKKH